MVSCIEINKKREQRRLRLIHNYSAERGQGRRKKVQNQGDPIVEGRKGRTSETKERGLPWSVCSCSGVRVERVRKSGWAKLQSKLRFFLSFLSLCASVKSVVVCTSFRFFILGFRRALTHARTHARKEGRKELHHTDKLNWKVWVEL